MKKLVVTVLLLGLAGCASKLPSAGIGKTYRQVAATVVSPNEPGWYLLNQSAYSVVFSKEYSSGETAIANTFLFGVGDFETDEAFFDAIKKGRSANIDIARFKQLEVLYQPFILKGQPCIKYSGMSEDHGSTGVNSNEFQYFKNFGFICRTNLDRTTALLMEVSHRSDSKVIPEELKKVADAFFTGIEMTP